MYLITSQGVIATLYPDLYTGSSDTFRSRRENLDGREKGSLSNESEVASLKAASGVPTMDLSPVPDCLALSPECAPASLLTVPLTTTCTEWKASIGCLENAGAVCTDAERDVIKSYEGALCDGDDEGPMLEESGSASAESKNSKLEVGVEDHLKGVPEESSLLRKSLIPTEDKISSYSASRRLDDAAHHFWDFRGSRTCRVYDDFATTVDLIAVPMNGATCSADGLSLDGNDDYADITDFEFGGTTSIEVYVKYDSFNNFGRVFDFSNGENSDNVYLSTWSTTSTVDWSVRRGSTQKALTTSNFDSSTWTHVVVTVSGTTMKIYKNGALAGTMTDGNEPNVLTRTQHWLGRSAWSTDGYFDGTIAYLKMWHGVELQQLDVTDLYAPHNTAHHFWDFRGCTTGGSVTDSIAGDLVATPVNGTTMKIYKNGALAGTKTDGHEPNVLTRTQHWLGRSAWSHHGYFDGTIAYLKMWHGVELQQLDVTDLYAPHNTAHHFWDFRGCTTGSPVRDSTCSSSCESSSVWYFPMNQNTQYFDAESFTFSAEWTIETWVYPTDSSSKFWLNFHSEDNCMLFQTKMFPNTNQWYHMVITYTSSGMTIYRDGVVTTDGIYSSYCGSPSGSLVFGNDQDGNVVNDPSQASGHYQSTVAIYNQAKSAEEIQGTAASTEINALDPTLYALWADNTGTDLTGNGNTATLTSASVAGGPSEHSGWKQRLR
ncbi:hypothetical protein TrST_g10650 [Triparma strigata]|uniref:Uncharacterized protein n=1 Tax=Triparma strigata TaxID=1606541 RepID=A0A9W7EK58_9STRA|nr:hypothetical protein TrST_g10650 [Triparma strigata]